MVRDNADGYQLIKPIADTLIAIADPEATGKITGDRLVTILAAGFNVPEPDSRNVFADLDTQQAGYLTPDQIHEAAQEFFLGTDSTAPANALFGRF
jgi:Ca2+-binding EF-hand superfamily protein